MPHEDSPNRREFFQARGAIRAARNGTRTLDLDVEDRDDEVAAGRIDASGAGYLLTVSRKAMACTFAVYLNASAGAAATEAALRALDLVEDLESQLTVYRATSEVIEINRAASVRPVRVEARLFDLLELAETIGRETDGAFDITSGPLSAAWGFSRREGRVPTTSEIESALARMGRDTWRLDRDAQTIQFEQPDVEIQLNGIGKGYALDRAGELLLGQSLASEDASGVVSDDAPRRVTDFLLHGGQSSVLAHGDNAARAGGGWSVGIRNPLRPKSRLGEIVLRDKALGTSGSATQSFRAGGKKFGHILDPRTGAPADGVYTSSVLAPTAAEADALATAFYVLGPEGAAKYCDAHPDVGALLVRPGERSGELVVDVINLSDDVWCAGQETV